MRDVEGISRASLVPLSGGQIKQHSAFGRGEDAQHVPSIFVGNHAQACISTSKLCSPEGDFCLDQIVIIRLEPHFVLSVISQPLVLF